MVCDLLVFLSHNPSSSTCAILLALSLILGIRGEGGCKGQRKAADQPLAAVGQRAVAVETDLSVKHPEPIFEKG